MAQKISLEKLLEVGAHFGHQARRWNPKMAPYLYGIESGVHIFDLTKTAGCLDEALAAIRDARLAGKTFLLVGTKKQAKEKIKEIGEREQVPYVSERWLGGTLTNFQQIKKTILKLKEMEEKMAGGEYSKYTKKERVLIEREIAKLRRFLGGLVKMERTPDLMVVIDAHKETGAVREARKLGVKIIGIVDSNADPEDVDYPIPMNDDASKAVDYVLDIIGEALGKSTASRKVRKAKKQG